jgi:Tfp pilus assembly protein PilF
MTRPLAAPLLLLIVVFAVFSPVLRNDFVNWDDQSEILENPSFNPVTIAGLTWNFSHTRLTLYMPVTYVTWGVVAAVAPRTPAGLLKPAAFHGLSLGLHGIATVLVFCLVRRCLTLTGDRSSQIADPGLNQNLPISNPQSAICNSSSSEYPRPGVLWYARRLKISSAGFGPEVAAFTGALIFAIHPIQTEAVAWASGMYTVLSTVWSVAAILCYLKHAVRLRDEPMTYARGWYFAATAFFALAVLTKASAVITPGVAGVLDLLLVGRPVKRVATSLGIWFVAGIPVVYAAKAFQDLSTVPAPPAWGRPLVAADAVGFYLRKIVWPVDFIPDYGRNPAWLMKQIAGLGPLNPGMDPAWATRHQWAIWPSMIVGALVTLMLFALLTARRAPRATAGGLVFLLGIAPYLGLTTFDFQYVSTVADRYAYFGMIGVALVAAAAVAHRRAWIILLAVAIPFAVMSYRQSKIWRSTQTLFDETLAVNPVSLVARNVFGFLAAKQGRPAEAEYLYNRALAVWPEDAVVYFNLGNLYASPSWFDAKQALNCYQAAVYYQPHFPVYRNSYAAMLARQGNFSEAISNWQQAIVDDPRYIDAHNNLASAWMTVGQPARAEAEYEAVLDIDPTNLTARNGLADAQRRSPNSGAESTAPVGRGASR